MIATFSSFVLDVRCAVHALLLHCHFDAVLRWIMDSSRQVYAIASEIVGDVVQAKWRESDSQDIYGATTVLQKATTLE